MTATHTAAGHRRAARRVRLLVVTFLALAAVALAVVSLAFILGQPAQAIGILITATALLIAAVLGVAAAARCDRRAKAVNR